MLLLSRCCCCCSIDQRLELHDSLTALRWRNRSSSRRRLDFLDRPLPLFIPLALEQGRIVRLVLLFLGNLFGERFRRTGRTQVLRTPAHLTGPAIDVDSLAILRTGATEMAPSIADKAGGKGQAAVVALDAAFRAGVDRMVRGPALVAASFDGSRRAGGIALLAVTLAAAFGGSCVLPRLELLRTLSDGVSVLATAKADQVPPPAAHGGLRLALAGQLGVLVVALRLGELGFRGDSFAFFRSSPLGGCRSGGGRFRGRRSVVGRHCHRRQEAKSGQASSRWTVPILAV
jgi:hypothetical protein